MLPMPNIVDCHLHAHWPQRYSYLEPTGSRIGMSDVAVSAEGLFPTLSDNGVTHTLIIQPGAYGTDNRAMLDAIAGSGGRAKGIAGMRLDASDEEFEDLRRKGIVGVRVSLIHAGREAFDRPEMGSFLKRCEKHDFYVEVFAAAATWPAIIPQLLDSGVHIIVEHVGWPLTPEGVRQPGFQEVLKLGRSTNAVIKVVTGFRLTQLGEPYDDVRPFVLEAIGAFGPDRCIWGTDWPFLNPDNGPIRRPFPGKVDYSRELHTLSSWISDEETLAKIFWETPTQLFGFEGT